MKRLKSSRDNCDIALPSVDYVAVELDDVGYNKFIPETFLADMLLTSKLLLQHIEITDDYYKQIAQLLDSFKIKSWVEDTVKVLKLLSERYDLREFERYALGEKDLKLEDVGASFNYPFELDSISEDVQLLLNISDEQMNEIEELPEDVVDVLTIATGIGKFGQTRAIHQNTEATPMSRYGEIAKVKHHHFADPLFHYKFAVKAYDVDRDVTQSVKAKRLVLAFFFDNVINMQKVSRLLKLLGVLAITSDAPELVVYELYNDTYVKTELFSKEEIIRYFKSPFQRRLFSISNNKLLKRITSENPGSQVVFIPNTSDTLTTSITSLAGCSINVIAPRVGPYNKNYQNVCRKTRGKFITL